MGNWYSEINEDWTLFISRDGVLTQSLKKGFISSVDELIFKPNVLENIGPLTTLFKNIILVTNQEAIGQGFLTHQQLAHVHTALLEQLNFFGGRIDEIYYCPDELHFDSVNRMPNPGLAWQAKKDFPSINFRKSVMIGSSDAEIQFGKNLKMCTVKIGSKAHSAADSTHPSIKDFLLYLNN
ncbi:MAG: HAD-IIIA family hydrolase [Saprospiraceae bacterium]|nr:HAD-IIIA family hydrolase [Saprospiraceae bacterium]